MAPAKQEQKVYEVGVIKLSEALKSEKIANVHTDDINATLRGVMMMIGLRTSNLPSKDETAILFTHILRNYASHTLQEITLAFEMALSGMLGLDEKEINCYENFSCLYFSKIMTAYRSWASNKHKTIKSTDSIAQLEYPEETQEEKESYLKEWEAREDFNINNVPPFLSENLIEFGRINPTNEEKWQYFYKAADVRKSDLFRDSEDAMMRNALNVKYVAAEYQAFLSMYLDQKYSDIENNRIRIIAKKLMIVDYLTANRDNKIKVSE